MMQFARLIELEDGQVVGLVVGGEPDSQICFSVGHFSDFHDTHSEYLCKVANGLG
ncbi:hypothetical protein DSECCO2_659450 [anaerobic digester metagenome]